MAGTNLHTNLIAPLSLIFVPIKTIQIFSTNVTFFRIQQYLCFSVTC
jgi:hypothetical protein